MKNPYAYTSREWEEETGDYYYRARYYDPRTGRFLSLDPIGYKSDDVNHYRYVLSNPLMYNDPSGNIASSNSEGAIDPIHNCISRANQEGFSRFRGITKVLTMTSSTALGACGFSGPAAPTCIAGVSAITIVGTSSAAVACAVETQKKKNKCEDLLK